MNLPGIRPFFLSDIIDTQPVHLTVYCLERQQEAAQNEQQGRNNNKNGNSSKAYTQQSHYRCYLSTYTDLELSHTVKSVSHRHMQWVASQLRQSPDTVLISSNDPESDFDRESTPEDSCSKDSIDSITGSISGDECAPNCV